MVKKLFFIFIIFFGFIQISFCVDEVFTFSSADKLTQQITFNSYPLTSFSFVIEGLESGSSFPSNIEIDIGDDGDNEWEYKPYHSSSEAIISKLYDVEYITGVDSNDRYFATGEDNNDFGTLLGSFEGSDFIPSINENSGNLVFLTSQDLSEGIYSLKTDVGYIHMFVPNIFSSIWTVGLYVAEGGSTYYCNSDHTFTSQGNCDLTLSEALVSDHLARKADKVEFDLKEFIPSTKPLLDEINDHLSSCPSFPCNIDFSISSDSQGIVNLQDIEGATLINPPDISISENSNSYSISISSDGSLTDVKYFYGDIPKVLVVPALAEDESLVLSSEQQSYLDSIYNNLSIKWDLLTENKHPLNFTFLKNPVKVEDYFIDDNNFNEYISKSLKSIETYLDYREANIVIILDVMDYFPTADPQNFRLSFEGIDVIGNIYINGFTSSNDKTSLNNYENEILNNIILHEMAHTFISYSGQSEYFYGDHPASFSPVVDFPVYSPLLSPTTDEGYFELYSILNQFRPYLLDAEIGETIKLSDLDKTILGISSKHLVGDYTFYSTQITKSTDSYLLSEITSIPQISVKSLYESTNSPYWNIIEESNKTSMGTSSSFSVSKDSQNNRALFIIAQDKTFDDHFEVFSNNVQSVVDIYDNDGPKVDNEVPLKPSFLKATKVSSNSVDLRWDESYDNIKISYYEIFRDSNKIGTSTNLYYSDLNLNGDTDYSYKVRSVDLVGNPSSFSDILDIKTLDIFTPILDNCGNYFIDSGEKCDRDALNGKICQDFKFDKGILKCKMDCSDYDLSSCSYDNDRVTINPSSTSGPSKSNNDVLGDEDISSPFSVKNINDIEFEKSCISDFKYNYWSSCRDGKQKRFIEDLNKCFGDTYEERNCKIGFSDRENLLFNAKKIYLQKINKKNYKAKLDSDYNEIFYVEEKLDVEIFFFEDENTKQKYYGQYYDSLDDKHYYTLKRVDEGYITILQNNIILEEIENNVNSKNNSHQFFIIFIWAISVFLFGLIIILGLKFFNKDD